MIAGDIFELQLVGAIDGQTTRNTFHFRMEDAVSFDASVDPALFPDLMDSIANLFADDLVTAFNAPLSSAFAWVGYQAFNLFSLEEFAKGAFSPVKAGTGTGTAMAPFVCYAFAQGTKRRDMRGGAKRFAGVREESVGSAGVIDPTQLTSLNNVATELGETRANTNLGVWTIQYRPVIVKRTGSPLNGGLPTTQTDAVWYYADNWEVKPIVSTQNTRKRGRGE